MVGADPLAPENLVVSTLHEFLQSQGTVLTKFPREATNLTAHFWIFQDPRVLNTGALSAHSCSWGHRDCGLRAS